MTLNLIFALLTFLQNLFDSLVVSLLDVVVSDEVVELQRQQTHCNACETDTKTKQQKITLSFLTDTDTGTHAIRVRFDSAR